MYRDFHEAAAAWQGDKSRLEQAGLILPNVRAYAFDGLKDDYTLLGMDAQPSLQTDPNSAVPAMLTTTIDPETIRVIFAPLAMADILTERQNGTWLEQTRMFPVVEYSGEVSSYGDFNNNGRAGVNMNWPSFQSYVYQTFISYGEMELARADLTKINYVQELTQSAAWALNQYQNLTYAYGVQGLQNYGILNNPYLSAPITPAVKAAGGTAWFTSGGSPNATANEVYNDIAAVIQKVIQQNNGNVDANTKMVLGMSPSRYQALTFTNSFGVFVKALLKEGYPNMTVKMAPQYGAQTASNPQGYSVAGEFMQLIVESIQGQRVAYAAYNEKMRAHKIIPDSSSWKQKTSQGTWGTILRMPTGVAGMLGI